MAKTEKKDEPKKEKYFEDQFDDEELLFVFRKHPIVMRKGLILSSIILALGVVPSLIKPEYSYLGIGLAVAFVIGLIIFIPFWVSWYYSVFIVTDQRLIQITQKGLWSRSVVDIGLPQIQMVNYEISGLEETIFGFGTIMMQTFVGDLIIHDVYKPEHIQKKLIAILRDRGIVISTPPGVNLQKTDEEDSS